MWDWMDKAEGKKEGSSFEGMNKERERQGYKKQSSPTKTKALEKHKKVGSPYEIKNGHLLTRKNLNYINGKIVSKKEWLDHHKATAE